MFYFVFATGTGYAVGEVSKTLLIVGTVLALAVLLTFYLLRSIGVYKLAKANGIEKPWIAFIPAVWMFTACKLIGESSGFFGQTYKKLALAFGIAFSVCAAVSLIDRALSYYPLISYALQAGETARIYYAGSYSSDFFASSGIPVYPYDSAFCVEGFVAAYPSWINGLLRVINILGIFTSIVSIVITVSVYFSLFRKFWPEHYILASLLSILLSLFPIFMFAVRNNKPVNYGEYMREKYRAFYA
ncbi:MAG: hypothetical protein J5697_00570, partial [Clostridia bacterium]|nr:hypothetical protein [Clostridia bacterium]